MSRPTQTPACARFLRIFAHAVKQISLYAPNHPIAISAAQDAWQLLHEIFAETGWPQACFGLSAGRWIANEEVVADSAQEFEILSGVFRAHALQTITFQPDCRPYEFLALCEMAGTPPNQAYKTDAADFLKERGVRSIKVNLEEFVSARKVRLPASLMVQNPLAGVAAKFRRPAASPQPTSPDSPQSFGSFIKSIVERGITEPQERAKLYAEALRYIEDSVARHVSEATHRLLLEKQGVLNERMRTESVLTTMAKGRVIIDQEGKIIMMDAAAEDIVGRPLSDLAGRHILESASDGDRFAALSKDLVLHENLPVSGKVDVSGGQEALEAQRSAMAVVHDERGRVVGTYGLLPHAAKFRETQRLQDEFIANITHDLKAPLSSICSALELLKQRLGAIGPDESEFLDISLRNSQVLRQMINEILDFSKLESGRMTIRPVPCAAGPILEDAVKALTPWARSQKIDLRLEASSSLPLVQADKGRVVQVLNNLLSNAIKFTPEGGSVVVSAFPGSENLQNMAVFSVKDTGCGIALPDQKRIFERFSQGSEGLLSEGVGLGLAIAREIVTLHRGQIWVESDPGKGSTFFFSLPLAPPGPSV
jgi:signal transduction histidine kinase